MDAPNLRIPITAQFLGADAFQAADTRLDQLTAEVRKTNASLGQLSAGNRRVAQQTRGMSRAQAQATEQVRNTTLAMKEQNKAFQRHGTNLKAITKNTALFLGVFAGFSAIARGTKAMANFEQTMFQVQAITGATGEELKGLAREARALGRQTEFTAVQAGEGLIYLARAGLSSQESLAALRPTFQLALAGQLDFGRAADIATNAVTQFNLAFNDTARVTDVMVQLSNSANTNITELASALNFAGPIAASANKEIEEVAAAIGVLGNAGIKATLAGTQLRGIILALASPTARGQKALQSLGLSLEDVDVSANSLVTVFERLRRANLELTTANAIFGKRQASGALAISRNVDEFKKLVAVNKEAAGAGERFQETVDQGVSKSLKKLGSAWEDLFITIGESGVNAALEATLDKLTEWTRSAGGIVDAASSVVGRAFRAISSNNTGDELPPALGGLAELGSGPALGLAEPSQIANQFADQLEKAFRNQVPDLSDAFSNLPGEAELERRLAGRQLVYEAFTRTIAALSGGLQRSGAVINQVIDSTSDTASRILAASPAVGRFFESIKSGASDASEGIRSSFASALQAVEDRIDLAESRAAETLKKLRNRDAIAVDLAILNNSSNTDALTALGLPNVANSPEVERALEEFRERVRREASLMGQEWSENFSLAIQDSFNAEVGYEEAFKRLGDRSGQVLASQLSNSALKPLQDSFGRLAQALAKPFELVGQVINKVIIDPVVNLISGLLNAMTAKLAEMLGIQAVATKTGAAALAATTAAATPLAAVLSKAAVAAAIASFGSALAFGPAALAQIASAQAVALTPLAEGGIVQARPGGTAALIGEAGQDEAVIPLDQLPGLISEGLAASGAGGTTNVVFSGTVFADRATLREMIEEAMRDIRDFDRPGGIG